MVRIKRTDAPVELTPTIVAQKTAEYKAAAVGSKPSVWNESYIKGALLSMSHNKCCYCECDVSEEGNYMEVEHFHPKGLYSDEVVLWDNLLPSCKRCNGRKHEHDTVAEPIVNPVSDVPNVHMKLLNCVRFRGKDDLGKMTVEVLNLNDMDRLVMVRCKISQEFVAKLEGLADWIGAEGQAVTTHRKRKLANTILDLLQACQPDKTYSAVKATTVLTDVNYQKIKNIMVQLGLWANEMSELEQKMLDCKYEVV